MARVGPIRKKPLPTVARVSELIHYDPLTGIFTWKVSRSGRWLIKPGDEAGTVRPDGYRIICIDGVTLSAHRIAWALMTGAWPEEIVDHIDTDPRNNRWDNLRLATPAQSAANRGVQSSSVLGVKGIRLRKGRYLAQIYVSGKSKFLGSFATLEEAKKVHGAAIKARDGEFART